MTTDNLKTIPKISVKIWQVTLTKLESKLEQACLRRDAYLNKMLETEIAYLDSEVSLPNSLAAQAHVQASLEGLNRKLVSLALRPELVAQLNEVCSRKRIVRDAFFNRLLLLLAAGPKVIDKLLFPFEDNWKQVVWNLYKGDSASWQSEFYPLQSNATPFWALREGMAAYANAKSAIDYVEPKSGRQVRVQRSLTGDVEPIDSIYTRYWGAEFKDADLTGLNCYVPNWHVPGDEAATRRQQPLDEII